jgi:hypothetical protein
LVDLKVDVIVTYATDGSFGGQVLLSVSHHGTRKLLQNDELTGPRMPASP